MKLLKVNKKLLAVFFGFIKLLKTDQFQNDDEIVQYRDKVKPAFEKLLPEYVLLWDESKELQRKVSIERMNELEVQKLGIENNTKFAKLDAENEEKSIQLELEDADFNLVFDLFGKSGKKIFVNPENYLEFKDAFNETNKQPKEKK